MNISVFALLFRSKFSSLTSNLNTQIGVRKIQSLERPENRLLITMTTNLSKELYFRLFFDLLAERQKLETALKYKNLYGQWGQFISLYITPFFWIFPFLAAILLVHTFRKKQLFGPMQKCLMVVMIIDVLFTMLTGFKDLIFNIFRWNYGYVEYKHCWFLLFFLRVQLVLNATSVWIKSLMLIHRVLLFLYPFKMKELNFKVVLIPFSIVHSVIISLFCAGDLPTPIKGFKTFQEYQPGSPLRKIEACIIEESDLILSQELIQAVYSFTFFVQTVYFTSLPICFHISCTFSLIYLVRKEIARLSFLTPNGSKKVLLNVNYLVLIKVHIYLSISFIVQEIPIFVVFFLSQSSQSAQDSIKMQSLIQIFMFQSFAVGKPIDFLIYASLSRLVKGELQKMFCCRKTRIEKR